VVENGGQAAESGERKAEESLDHFGLLSSAKIQEKLKNNREVTDLPIEDL
jgi:hypothetical protein